MGFYWNLAWIWWELDCDFNGTKIRGMSWEKTNGFGAWDESSIDFSGRELQKEDLGKLMISLVVWLPFFCFPINIGLRLASQSTNIFQRGSNHQPVMGFLIVGFGGKNGVVQAPKFSDTNEMQWINGKQWDVQPRIQVYSHLMWVAKGISWYTTKTLLLIAPPWDEMDGTSTSKNRGSKMVQQKQ